MRLDLPDPEIPVTLVKTPSGISTSRPIKIVAGDPAKLEPAAGVSGRLGNSCRPGRTGKVAFGIPHVCEARQRTAVDDLAALLAGAGTDVDDPVRMPHDVEFVLDDEQRVAGRLQASSARSSASVSAGCSPADGSSRT